VIQKTVARLLSKESDLLFQRIDEDVLEIRTGGERGVQRRTMAIAAPLHLEDQFLMPVVESAELAGPAEGLGMQAVAPLAEHMDVPEAMQLAMFAQQMLPAEQTWIDVPDSQVSSSSGGVSTRGWNPRHPRTGIRG
jgi:hypothetical protein